MDENGKVKEEVPKSLEILIRRKIKLMLNSFGELCDTLEKLGITFESDSETSDSNVFLIDDEALDDKNMVTKKEPELLQVSAMASSRSKTSKTHGVNTNGSEVLSSGIDETETSISIIKCLDNESYASTSDIDIEFSDCSSEISTAAVKSWDGDSDISSSSESSESDSEVSSTSMMPEINRMLLRSVENYSDGDSMVCLSETSTNTVEFAHCNTEGSAISVDQATEGLLLEILSSDNPQKIVGEILSYHSQKICRAFNSSYSGSKSLHPDLKFSDSAQESYTDKQCNNIYDSPSIDREVTILEDESFHGDPALDKYRVTSVDAGETWGDYEMFDVDLEMKRRMRSGNPVYDSGKTLFDFADALIETRIKSSDGDEESEKCLDRHRENISSVIELINLNNNAVQSQNFEREAIVTAEKSLHDYSGLDNYQEKSVSSAETEVRKEVSATLKFAADDWESQSQAVEFKRDPRSTSDEFIAEPNPALKDDQKSPGSPDEATDCHPDSLANIFQTFVKSHPIKTSEILPYLSANAERTSDITGRKLNGSCMKHTDNDMPQYGNDESQNILENCFPDIDSHSVMVFEVVDVFSENSSQTCDAFITKYLNTAAQLKLFFTQNVKDVSTKDYELRMGILLSLDDELGYLSAKLIRARNDWVKQFYDVKRNLLNNSPLITRTRGLYYTGILRVCVQLTNILLNFCIEKQLELEEYEKELIFYYELRK